MGAAKHFAIASPAFLGNSWLFPCFSFVHNYLVVFDVCTPIHNSSELLLSFFPIISGFTCEGT